MLINPLGMSYNPFSTIVVDATALTPTSSLDLSGNLKYRVFEGPGERGQQNALDRGISARFLKYQKLTTYNLIASRQEVQTSSLEEEETGFVRGSGMTIAHRLGGGLRHRFGPRDTVDWQTIWNSRTFSGGRGTPIDTLTSFAVWSHEVSPITALIPSLQFQHLTYHNAAESEVMFWTAKTAIQTRLTERLSLQAEAGATLLNSTNNRPGAVGSTLPLFDGIVDPTVVTNVVGDGPTLPSSNGIIDPSIPPAGTAIDWIGNIRLLYTLKTAELGAFVARTTGPTSFGQFLKKEEVRLFARYFINDDSSVLVSGAFIHQTPARGSSTDRIDATVAYNRTLAREWHAQLAYRYRQNITETGTARSNGLFAVLTRHVTILP